jgi:hypothetical protein
MAAPFTIYGFPDECRKFAERHPLWQETIANLVVALNLAFTRVQTMIAPEDKFVYLYGSVCREDFMEILLLCYHGYGVAASKLVRSMYEHTVTLRYLHEHPDEIGTFLNYHRIQNDKLISRLVETFGDQILPANVVAEAESKAAEVKNEFMIPVCDHPGAKMRLNHTWNKLDFVAMAKKTGGLGELIVTGYYLPMRHAHATFGGLSERLEIVDGQMGLNVDSQPQITDRSLMTAHTCLLDVMDAQKERFQIEGLEEATQVCYQDFIRVWSPDTILVKK